MLLAGKPYFWLVPFLAIKVESGFGLNLLSLGSLFRLPELSLVPNWSSCDERPAHCSWVCSRTIKGFNVAGLNDLERPPHFFYQQLSCLIMVPEQILARQVYSHWVDPVSQIVVGSSMMQWCTQWSAKKTGFPLWDGFDHIRYVPWFDHGTWTVHEMCSFQHHQNWWFVVFLAIYHSVRTLFHCPLPLTTWVFVGSQQEERQIKSNKS